MKKTKFLGALLAALFTAATIPDAQALPYRHGLKACRVQGVEHEAYCGKVSQPFDPNRPQGLQIEVSYVVVPALARNRLRDPVIFFAGGPGQSAIELAGPVSRMLSRVGYRRDVVFIDQRGTGRTAPLRCPDELPTRPLSDTASTEGMIARLAACRAELQKLPHGDLRNFTTLLAVRDIDAVRVALEVDHVNIVGGSYGTRVALEYMRQRPQSVRRVIIDGVAPPDMALPASFSGDTQAALDAELAACDAEPRCRARYPALRADWAALLASLPRQATVLHPVTGAAERVNFTRDTVLGLVRSPLYVPTLASALPMAITEAARGRFEPLIGLSSVSIGNRQGSIAEGMHFSVICSEDWPRMAQAKEAPGADYADSVAQIYGKVCADWPRGNVPKEFYALPPAGSATLLLSGGADPVTPPRHAERVAKALGSRALHVVVPQAGHGVMRLGCMRDVIYKFISAPNDAEALKVDTECAKAVPRPSAFLPVAEVAK